MKKMVKRIINTLSQMLYILCIKKNHVNYGANCSFNGWGHIYNAGSILIGENVQINSGLKYNPIGGDTRNIIRVYKDASLIIGNHVGISNSAIVANKRIVIGNHVLIGGGCKIYDSDFHSLKVSERREKQTETIKKSDVFIEDDVFIGAHCIILKGAHIGKGSIIGAGSVVCGTVPSGEIWAGNPAKFIRKVE